MFRRLKRAFEKTAECRSHFGAAKDERFVPQA
jgi:hypothetical protein